MSATSWVAYLTNADLFSITGRLPVSISLTLTKGGRGGDLVTHAEFRESIRKQMNTPLMYG